MANPLAKLEKAFRRDPDSPLFARLADLYLEVGDVERALELCEEGCAAFPEYSTGFVVLSKCYEDQGEVEKAREAMGHALRLDPENPGGYKRLSDLFQQLGVFPLALQSLQQAAYLDPFDETLDEQIDHLNYQARKVSTQVDATAEVSPLPAQEAAAETETVEALIAGHAQPADTADTADPEVAEPFAQVQALPEWSDSPDVGEALKEFAQGPNPLFAEDGGPQTIEPEAQPDIGEIAGAQESPPPPAPAPDDARDDAVAALGMEIFGEQMPAPPESADATEPPAAQPPAFAAATEATWDAPADPPAATTDTPAADTEPIAALAPGGEGEEAVGVDADTATTDAEQETVAATDLETADPLDIEDAPVAQGEAAPSDDGWVRFSAQENKPDHATPDEISIFSPDILPADSEIFKPQIPPGLAAEADTPAPVPPQPEAAPEPAAAEASATPETPVEETTENPVATPLLPLDDGAQTPTAPPTITPETPVDDSAETPAPFFSSAGENTADTSESLADLEPTESAVEQPSAPAPFLFGSAATPDHTDTADEVAPQAEQAPAEAPDTAPAPFLFGAAEEEDDDDGADAEDLALPEVAAEADKPFFFTAGVPTPATAPEETPASETAPEPQESVEEPADATASFFAAGDPVAQDANASEPFGSPLGPEMAPTREDDASLLADLGSSMTPADAQPTETTDTPADAQPVETTDTPADAQPVETTDTPADAQPTETTDTPADAQPVAAPNTPAAPMTSFLSGSAITGSRPSEAKEPHDDAEPPPAEGLEALADLAPTADADTSSFFGAAAPAEEAEAPEAPPTSTDETAEPEPKSDAELLRLFQEIEQEAPAETQPAETEQETAPSAPEPIPEVPAPTLAPVSDAPKPPDELKPDHPEEKRIATMTLAEIYTIQGLTQKAIETYRELLEQDPNNTILRSKLEALEKSSGRQ